MALNSHDAKAYREKVHAMILNELPNARLWQKEKAEDGSVIEIWQPYRTHLFFVIHYYKHGDGFNLYREVELDLSWESFKRELQNY